MATPTAPWPCPECAELLTNHLEDCPHCGLPAAWVDLLLALGFTVRQFHYWSVVGALDKDQYRAIVDAVRRRQDELARAAHAEEPLPSSGLPDRSTCCQCGRPCSPTARVCRQCGTALDSAEVRLFRYQKFFGQEIRDHAEAARLTPRQVEHFLGELSNSLQDLDRRLAANRNG